MAKRRARWLLLILVLALFTAAAGCSSRNNGSGGGAGTEPQTQPQTESEAGKLLGEAAAASHKLKRYAIRMHLEQNLDHQGTKERVKVNASGTVSRNPLQMQQTIQGDYDGDVSEIRTILTPNNYYIFDPMIGLWNKLPKKEIEAVRSALSDFQSDPGALLESMRNNAGGFDLTKTAEGTALTLTEQDKGAMVLLSDILASTLGGGGMDEKVRSSIKLKKLVYKATLDPAHLRLLRLDAVSEMDMEFEPGVQTKVSQTLTVKYGEFDTAKPVEVPKEALDAPEVMQPGPDAPGMNDGL